MKKLLLLIALLLSTICLYAQNLEWAPIGATWYYSNPKDSWDTLQTYEKYISEKDTVVQEKTCRLIKSPSSSEIMYEENGRVYYFFQDDFHLIYDYTANVGDTIEFEFKSLYLYMGQERADVAFRDTVYTVECVLTRLDTTMVGSEQIRGFAMSIIPNVNMIDIPWERDYYYQERIGCGYGFIFKVSRLKLSNERYYILRCYHDSELEYMTDWWKSKNKECDYYLSSTPTMFEKKKLNINIVQDLSNKTISIRCNEIPLPKNLSMKIFDTFGKVVKDIKVTNADTEFNTSSMSSGIYFVSFIQHNNVVKTAKIIIP